MFNLLGNHQATFQSGFIILHSHQLCVRGLDFPPFSSVFIFFTPFVIWFPSGIFTGGGFQRPALPMEIWSVCWVFSFAPPGPSLPCSALWTWLFSNVQLGSANEIGRQEDSDIRVLILPASALPQATPPIGSAVHKAVPQGSVAAYPSAPRVPAVVPAVLLWHQGSVTSLLVPLSPTLTGPLADTPWLPSAYKCAVFPVGTLTDTGRDRVLPSPFCCPTALPVSANDRWLQSCV